MEVAAGLLDRVSGLVYVERQLYIKVVIQDKYTAFTSP